MATVGDSHYCALAERAGVPVGVLSMGTALGAGRYLSQPDWRLIVDCGDFPAWTVVAYCPWCGGCLKCIAEAGDGDG